MKPERSSNILLGVARAKAKMYEYGVPEELAIDIKNDPGKLLILSIGLLGDIASGINKGTLHDENLKKVRDDLTFSAYYFDSYLQSRLGQETYNTYLLLLGSAAYYLSGLPGSANVLVKNLTYPMLELDADGLEIFLLWLLQFKLEKSPEFSSVVYGENIELLTKEIRDYYNSGNGKESLLSNTTQLRTKAYHNGTNRQLLFADIICAIIRKRIENSSRDCLPRFSNLPPEVWEGILKNQRFIRELWPAQLLLGEKGIYSGKSAVVQMPTSAGKTRAAEIIIRSAFLSSRTSLAVIVAPFRALCHEIRNSLLSAFTGETVFIDELSDVLQKDFILDELLGRKQILVVTPEKLLYVLRHNSEIAEHIGLLIYDEGHQFDSGTRGVTYELLLTSLKRMVPKGIQTVLLSAVIENAESIGKWLNGDNFELISGTNLNPTYRTIAFTSWLGTLGRLDFVDPEDPDENEFFVPRIIERQELELKPRERTRRYFPQKDDSGSIALFLGLRLVANGAVAIFCGTKTSAQSLCNKVIEAYNRGLTLKKPIELLQDTTEARKLAYLYAKNLGDDAEASNAAKLGIFSHHSNIPQGIRLAVEHSMKFGEIKFVICTSTLAQGVNLPIRYLIVAGIYQGLERIKTRDFHNLIGRAGRAGEHTEGTILFADSELFDNRKTVDGLWKWDLVKELLDPSKSEPCASSLLSICDPIYSDNEKLSLTETPVEIVQAYTNNKIEELIENYRSKYERYGFSKPRLLNQIDKKMGIITSIENYLMSHWDETKAELQYDDIVQLVSETLAYFLANDEQKSQLFEIFMALEKNIEKRVPNPQKRKIFSSTMYGVETSITIEDWVNENLEHLDKCTEQDALFKMLWPIVAINIQNSPFKKCYPPESLMTLGLAWIDGIPFKDLLQNMLKEGIVLHSGRQIRTPDIDTIVDICENGFAYEGALVVSAITELIESLQNEKYAALISNLLELQKQLKYGLPSPLNIAVFELGLMDRVLCQEITSLLGDITTDKKSISESIKHNDKAINEAMVKYPSYFQVRLNALLR